VSLYRAKQKTSRKKTNARTWVHLYQAKTGVKFNHDIYLRTVFQNWKKSGTRSALPLPGSCDHDQVL